MALADVLERQDFVLGREVSQLEEVMAQRCGARFAIACASGSDALLLALMARDVKAGDEVVVPAYTWEGTVGPILQINAVPVFVDIDPDTYCLDARLIEKALTPKTRAILPVHLAMRFADLDALVVTGRAPTLSCLCVGSRRIEVRDVHFMRGFDISKPLEERIDPALVTDYLVHRFTIAGDAEECAERVRELAAAGVKRLLLTPPEAIYLEIVEAWGRDVIPKL